MINNNSPCLYLGAGWQPKDNTHYMGSLDGDRTVKAEGWQGAQVSSAGTGRAGNFGARREEV